MATRSTGSASTGSSSTDSTTSGGEAGGRVVRPAESRARAAAARTLSAAAMERDIKRGIEAGFYRYLTRPVRVDELIATLEEVLIKPSPSPG